ncbi:hypothetical protein FIV38_18815 [Pseudomonas proteolytica]|nr:hypothetical protein F4W61_14040 [Pseudomonas proteolytica]QHG25765.1 hypothetical protein GDV60_24040 [Pseudomonas sp. DTU12.1]TWR79140.1 hypothetical protein FIV38_18815 [Pseudomonas proteolytica]
MRACGSANTLKDQQAKSAPIKLRISDILQGSCGSELAREKRKGTALILNVRGAFESFASKLAPTEVGIKISRSAFQPMP